MKIANKGEELNLLKYSVLEYQEKVFDYLEYIGYPELITFFKPEDVAQSLSNTIKKLYLMNISYRKCAIVIFSLTMEYQVKTYSKHLAERYGVN